MYVAPHERDKHSFVFFVHWIKGLDKQLGEPIGLYLVGIPLSLWVFFPRDWEFGMDVVSLENFLLL